MFNVEARVEIDFWADGGAGGVMLYKVTQTRRQANKDSTGYLSRGGQPQASIDNWAPGGRRFFRCSGRSRLERESPSLDTSVFLPSIPSTIASIEFNLHPDLDNLDNHDNLLIMSMKRLRLMEGITICMYVLS